MHTRIPFKFGDRQDVTTSMARPLAARTKFLRSLIRQGFHETDLLVRYFFYEPFHDGSIRIEHVDTSRGLVAIAFENVSVMDQVSAAVPMRKHALNRDVYRTKVTFNSVSAFQVLSSTPLRNPKYYSAEFWKMADHLELTICFTYDWSATEVGYIQVAFKAIEVEDISKRLAKFAGKPSDISAWLMKKPPKLKAQLQRDLVFLSQLKKKKNI
jgi:hypothetical protein